jgi:CO dehydrogenase/acetyl-CoA synthase gamma subunit (corrinoid Fe-S protein)
MRNLKVLVGTEDFLHRLELTFHNYNHFDNEYFMRIIQKENKSAYLYLEITLP